MTALLGSSPSEVTNTVFERVRALLPEIAARAAEGERERAVPAEIVSALREAGAFRMALPKTWGGEELGLPQAGAVIREIARADASTAWVVQVGSMAWAFIRGIPRHTFEEEIFAGGADVMIRGAAAPKGLAKRVDGGYRISGRWPLASGAYAPDWVLAGFLVEGADPLPDGRPDIRVAVVRPEDVTFHDTWDAVGLRGTQSDDFSMDDVFVPEHRTGSLFNDNSFPAPLFTLPFPAAGGTHDALVIGVLAGSLDDLAELGAKKRPTFNPAMVLGQDPVFQETLGELELRTSALAALADHTSQTVMDRALFGAKPTPEEWTRYLAGHQHIHREGVRILNEMMSLSGSTAVYHSNSLQRRWRDLRCVAQHVVANAGMVRALGALRSGQR
jgi:indole-3-acetate monooxygenase